MGDARQWITWNLPGWLHASSTGLLQGINAAPGDADAIGAIQCNTASWMRMAGQPA